MVQPVHVIDSRCDADVFAELLALAGPDATIFWTGPRPDFAAGKGRSLAASRWWCQHRGLEAALAGSGIIHCWSLGAAVRFSRIVPTDPNRPHVIRCAAAPTDREQDLLRHGLLEEWRVSIVCADEFVRAALEEAGVREDLRVIGPLAAGPPDGQERSAARQRLGVGPAEKLVVTPAFANRSSGHKYAIWSTAILSVAEFPLRLAFRADAPAEREAVCFARDAGFPELVRLAELSLEQLLAGADYALFLNESELPPRAVASAMLAGLPIVGPDTPAGRAWLQDGQTALLVPPNKPRAIARALLRLLEHAELPERLGKQAHARAQQCFQPEQVRRSWHGLYELLARSTASDPPRR